jgi:uncharacterized protein
MAPAFLCDGMLGHLARWLRLMGWDTEYAGSVLSDEEILAELKARPRVLLTRDIALHGRAVRQGARAVLVAEAPLVDELLQTLREGGVPSEPARWFTRCTTCNGLLRPATATEMASRVPERVRMERQAFQACERCGQVYWEGTHVEPIRATLEGVVRRLAAAP